MEQKKSLVDKLVIEFGGTKLTTKSEKDSAASIPIKENEEEIKGPRLFGAIVDYFLGSGKKYTLIAEPERNSVGGNYYVMSQNEYISVKRVDYDGVRVYHSNSN